MWYLLVLFHLRICGSSRGHGVVCDCGVCWSCAEEYVVPQGTTGLSIIEIRTRQVIFYHIYFRVKPITANTVYSC